MAPLRISLQVDKGVLGAAGAGHDLAIKLGHDFDLEFSR